MADGGAASGDLGAAVQDAHVLVVTGAGGVGKTTVAAALGLAGARAGRRTLVLTIDPARRLAQALGIEGLDNSPRAVRLPDGAQLDAAMLDMQTTFDALIDRHAPSGERADAIKENRVYRTLASTLSGTQEYMAMEKLHELHERGDWDLLVIDTPPTRHALDFLDAPRRMTSFLEGRLLRMLTRPGITAGRSYLRALNLGATAFMRVAGRVTGMQLLDDLAEFFRSFEGMYEGFKQRAEDVLDLMREPSSQFVVVASAQPPPLREARFFLERLQQEGLHLAGVVVNRVHATCPSCPEGDDLRAAAGRLDDTDADGRAVAHNLRLLADVQALAARERRDVAAALFGIAPPVQVEVPLLRSDVHDLSTLEEIAGILTGKR